MVMLMDDFNHILQGYSAGTGEITEATHKNMGKIGQHLNKTKHNKMLICAYIIGLLYRADSRFTPSQWEMALLCNKVSHLLGASLESALLYVTDSGIC